MKGIPRLTIRLCMLAVTAVLLVGTGSVASAQFGASGIVAGCVGRFTGLIRGIDERTGSCRPGDVAIFWYTKDGADRAFGFTCPPDSVQSGRTCIDKYEASVWETTNATVIAKIRDGTVTLADLTATGAIQLGLTFGDLAAAGCPDTGNGCVNFFAVSIAGVTPSQFITWFQAAAAARNAGKRLPTNAEWQSAALGTPDPGASPGCNTLSGGPDLTGARVNCVSDVGAFDMVGNLAEWVADLVPRSATCVPSLFGTDDLNCLAGASTLSSPGAVLRGGNYGYATAAGVFAVDGGFPPSGAGSAVGFRAAR